jgi:hypothetical protein
MEPAFFNGQFLLLSPYRNLRVYGHRLTFMHHFLAEHLHNLGYFDILTISGSLGWRFVWLSQQWSLVLRTLGLGLERRPAGAVSLVVPAGRC